ncbi:MAG: hypothetical protein IPO12_08710 [Flavobacteriales bacterium]|nr:hypothetical protein [Flavobacteriales bacterium]
MRASLFSLLLLPLLACGQSWCVPGATWRYNVLFIYGYIEYSYAGDTLINGMEAQVLDVATAFQYPQPPPEPPSPPQYTYDPVAYITRNEGIGVPVGYSLADMGHAVLVGRPSGRRLDHGAWWPSLPSIRSA